MITITYDFEHTCLKTKLLGDMLRSMPEKALIGVDYYRWHMSPVLWERYKNLMNSRAIVGGIHLVTEPEEVISYGIGVKVTDETDCIELVGNQVMESGHLGKFVDVVVRGINIRFSM